MYICKAYICQVIKKALSQVHFLSSIKFFVDSVKPRLPSILKVIMHFTNSVDNEADDYIVNIIVLHLVTISYIPVLFCVTNVTHFTNSVDSEANNCIVNHCHFTPLGDNLLLHK